jgi:hypothetical protein
MSTYTDLKTAVEGLGIPASALAMPDAVPTYAVIRMLVHQAEQSADDQPSVYGAYMQVDLFTTADADTKARAIMNAAMAAGFAYRGRSDDFLNDRQHVEIRLMKLEG